MKRPKNASRWLMMLPAAALALSVSAAEENPRADEGAVVSCGNTRFTVLTPEMIRIQHSESGKFDDRATFAVRNRRMPVPRYTTERTDSFLIIDTDKLTLRYRIGSTPATSPAGPGNLSITLNCGGAPVEWYPGKPDPQNLKGTCRTLDCSNGDNKRAEMEQGMVSRSGWAVIDDSPRATRADGSRSFPTEYNPALGYDWWAAPLDPDATDLYFLGYGHDYKKAMDDFTRLCGRIPLPPDYVFGYWYSKYDAYSSDDFRNIMAELKRNGIRTEVMIIDMDWHWNGEESCGSKGRGAWTGWSWNTNLIPDAGKLLADMHANNLKVALNLHPAFGVDSVESPQYFRAMNSQTGGRYELDKGKLAWSLDFPDFTGSFFSNIIRDHEREGVDFWWLDWQQHLTSPYTEGLGETLWCNHVFYNDMKRNRPDRRPLIFHRWGGLGSHRYQIGFSGDTFINFPTLAFQPWFTSTAANVGYAYWGHDLGGHAIGNPDEENLANNEELVLRWIQFGVFTPIFRTHATKDPRIERRMWKFREFPLMREAVDLRYALFPYIYTMARKAYDTGLAICRPMYYDYPEEDEAYSREGQYLFGDDILVAPITEPMEEGAMASVKEIWFPEGEWWDSTHSRMIKGPATATLDFALSEIPYFYRAGAVVPNNPDGVRSVKDRPGEMILNVISGGSGSASVYEDRGDNTDYATSYATTAIDHRMEGNIETLSIAPRSGDSSGLSPRRAWELRVHNASRPSEVKLDGVPVGEDEWSYDEGKRMLKLTTPMKPCNEGTDLEIKY